MLQARQPPQDAAMDGSGSPAFLLCQMARKFMAARMSPRHTKAPGASTMKVKGLKAGDHVLLSWRHDYVTREGASFPERPITKLEGIGQDTAEELMK